ERRERGTIAIVAAQVVLADLVTEQGVVPCDVAADQLRVRVEEQLVRVEPVPFRRVERAVDAIPVQLPGENVRHVAIPDLVGALLQFDPCGCLRRGWRVEQAKLDFSGRLGEQGEINAGPVPGGPERVRAARPDAHGRTPEGTKQRPLAFIAWAAYLNGSIVTANCARLMTANAVPTEKRNRGGGAPRIGGGQVPPRAECFP